MSARKLKKSTIYDSDKDLNPLQVIDHALDGYDHILQKRSSDYIKESKSAQQILNEPESIFTKPIDCVLPDGGELVFDAEFGHIKEKSELLKTIRKTLQTFVKRESYIDEIITVADEMITNALYNAPFVKASNESSGIERNSNDARLESVKKAYFFMGKSETRFVIGCRDSYGKLNVPRLLERIKYCYDNSVAEAINMNSDGGAGIGTYIIYNTSSSLTVAVHPDHQTIFCSVFDIKMNNKNRDKKLKHLHLVY